MNAKMIIGGAVLAASTLAGTAVAGPFSANIGVTSNYLFRGVTQTADAAAVQGGVDYENENGFYAGTWISNLASGSAAYYGSQGNFEQDWYLGYGFQAGPVGLDVGYILYTYPVSSIEADYGEIYLNASWEWLSGGIAYTTNKEASGADTGDIYLYVSGDFEAKSGLGYGFTVGRYDFKGGSAGDYNHVRLYMSKSDFTLAFEKNDTDTAVWGTGSDDYRFTVSWAKSFDL